MENDNILNKAISKGKEISKNMQIESKGEYVGSEQSETIIVDNKRYKINITSFWEKINHFDCSVTGLDDSYYNYKGLITF